MTAVRAPGFRGHLRGFPAARYPAKCLVRAEDRGFEPRRVLPPNRISSAPAAVPLRSDYHRESAEPQATGTGKLSNLPGRAGFSPGVRACLVRARCVHPADRHALVKSASRHRDRPRLALTPPGRAADPSRSPQEKNPWTPASRRRLARQRHARATRSVRPPAAAAAGRPAGRCPVMSACSAPPRRPSRPLAASPARPARGYHVSRFAQAQPHGPISAAELLRSPPRRARSRPPRSSTTPSRGEP